VQAKLLSPTDLPTFSPDTTQTELSALVPTCLDGYKKLSGMASEEAGVLLGSGERELPLFREQIFYLGDHAQEGMAYVRSDSIGCTRANLSYRGRRFSGMGRPLPFERLETDSVAYQFVLSSTDGESPAHLTVDVIAIRQLDAELALVVYVAAAAPDVATVQGGVERAASDLASVK
jgi:hypothetical protein